MNGCLRDRELFLLAADEGTIAAHAHLQNCLSCTRRYQHLTWQLDSIEQTLRYTDPPKVSTPAPVLLRYWPPLTAALAAAALLLGINMWTPSSEQQSAHTSASVAEETLAFDWEQEWTPVVLATEDELPLAPLASVPSEAYLQAAMTEGGWPCEWQDPFLTPTCEIYPFPIALAMQSLEEVMYE